MKKAKWTFMVFIAGDNDLQGAGYNDIDEMKRVGSNPNLNIVVQFDNMHEQTVKRYYIKKGEAESVQVLPETNTGDPKVLSDFIAWAMTNYPAEHYLVDVWNHGTGWEDVPEDFDYDTMRGVRAGAKEELKKNLKRSIFFSTIKEVHDDEDNQRAIAIDVNSRDFLDNQELKKALASTGQKIDVVGFDACLMNMLEVAYQLKDNADYIVGSEELEPGPGWAYNKVLGILSKTPDTSPKSLVQQMVRQYAETYKNSQTVTQSALNIVNVKTVAEAVDRLGALLTPHLQKLYRDLLVLRGDVQDFDNPNYVDLYDLASLIKQAIPQAKIKDAADNVMKAVFSEADEALVIENFSSQDLQYARGISIYFPTRRQVLQKSRHSYEKLDFVKEHGNWMKFLDAYVNYSPLRSGRSSA